MHADCGHKHLAVCGLFAAREQGSHDSSSIYVALELQRTQIEYDLMCSAFPYSVRMRNWRVCTQIFAE